MKRSSSFVFGLSVAVLLQLATAIHAGDHYKAFVHSRLADVRCSPHEAAYLTDRLGRGAEVHVYKRGEDGWLAIRPSSDQFSLVRASAIKLNENGTLGEVVQDKALAWVGSDFANPDELESHVTLDLGEVVEVLGRREGALRPGDTDEKLYEIAPPRGEFRWVRASDVRRRKPTVEATEVQFADLQSSTSARSTSNDAVAAADNSLQNSRPAGGWQSRTQFRSRKMGAGSRVQVAAGESVSIERLHADLARAVQGDAATWDLKPLKQKCQALMETSRSMVERGQARLAMSRIKEFEDLQARKTSSIGDAGAQIATRTPSTDLPRKSTTTDVAGVGYDGVGILMPVTSTKQTSFPPYALMDRNNKVIRFVTPAPGLNLNRYVKQEIGVLGQRGYIRAHDGTGATGNHVTAERVVSLQRHRR